MMQEVPWSEDFKENVRLFGWPDIVPVYEWDRIRRSANFPWSLMTYVTNDRDKKVWIVAYSGD